MTTEQIIEHYENIVKAETFEVMTLSGFSEACHGMNIENELADCLVDFNHDDPDKSADKTDCKEWGINGAQWFDEIEKALICMIADRLGV